MLIRPLQFFKWLTLISITLLLAGVAYYYYHQGFGRHWRALLTKEFHTFGLEIRVRRLTLDPFRGLVAKDLEIYDNDRKQAILAQISDLSLDINYANLLQQEPALNAVDLHEAKISIPIDPTAPKAGRIHLTGLQSRIYFFPGRIEVRQAAGMIFGIHLQASGTLVNPAAFSLHPTLESRPRPDQKAQQNFIRLLIKEIEMLRFSGERPQLDFTFQVDLANPASLRLEGGHLFSGNLVRKDYQLQNLDCQFSLEQQKLDLQKLFMRDGRGELFATGTWNLASGEKNFQIRSGLDPAKLLANDPRFPWAKEWRFDAPPEIEVSGVAQPDGHLQVLGQTELRPIFFPKCELPRHESRVLEIRPVLDGDERAGDPSFWHLVRRCAQSPGRFSDANQLGIESNRADAPVPAEISTCFDRLGISNPTGDSSQFLKCHLRILEAFGNRTNLAWKNKISGRASQLSFSKL